jgi:hypothetical protein
VRAVPFADDQAHKEIAERIQQDNPNWLVMWGTYTRQYTAFALFDAPPGTVLRGQDPDELAARIRQAEQLQLNSGGGSRLSNPGVSRDPDR